MNHAHDSREADDPDRGPDGLDRSTLEPTGERAARRESPPHLDTGEVTEREPNGGRPAEADAAGRGSPGRIRDSGRPVPTSEQPPLPLDMTGSGGEVIDLRLRVLPATERHVRLAHEKLLVASSRGPIELSDDAVRALVEALGRTHSFLDGESTASQVVELATATVMYCVGFGITLDPRTDEAISLYLLDVWLEEIGWHRVDGAHERAALMAALRWVPGVPEQPRAEVRASIVTWMLGALLDPSMGSAGDLLDETRPTEPMRAFVAVAMSERNADAVAARLEVCEILAAALSGAGILSYQPLRVHDPRLTPEVTDDPYNRVLNERQIASSDLVVLVAEPPASGLGVVAALADKYGCRVVPATLR